MQSRRFIADDMRQALKKVRDVLGPDAIILNNRRVPGGIEVTATIETLSSSRAEKAPAQSAPQQLDEPGQKDGVFAQLLNAHQQVQPKAGDDELVATLRSEIENLRLLLKDQMADQRKDSWNASHPVAAAVRQRLQNLGVSTAVIEQALASAASHPTIDEGWQASLGWLKQSLPIPPQEILAEGGCFAFVGPTGAGKTTTLAKLAVRFALRHGRDSLALVTTDQQRMGAFEQLRSLGRILGIDVRVADETQSLSSILRELRDRKLVLVDTGGLPLDAKKREAQLTQLRVCSQLRNLLVLPATSQATVLNNTIQRLGGLSIDGAIISKVDEADSLGEVLSLVVEKRLPVSYITHGPAIPEDIKLARADALINRLLACSGQRRGAADVVPCLAAMVQSADPQGQPAAALWS